MTRKTFFFTGVVVALSLSLAWKVYASHGGSPDIWGPYTCTSCQLGTPMPDAPTLAYIHVKENENYPGLVGHLWKDPGDQYIMCNGTHCATYTRTNSGGFLGGNVVHQQNAGGGAPPLPSPPPGSGDTWGIVGFTPVYATGQVCTAGSCTSQTILVGYNAIYGWIKGAGGGPFEQER